MKKAIIGLLSLFMLIGMASASPTVNELKWDTLDGSQYDSISGDFGGAWDVSGTGSSQGEFTINISDWDGVERIEFDSEYSFDYVNWYLYVDGQQVDSQSSNDQNTLTLDGNGVEGDTLTVNTSTGNTGSTKVTALRIYTQKDIETTSFSQAVNFADDYFEKPDSLSCALSYAPLFGDCWVDYGIFTFGDDSKDIFLEDLEANAKIAEEDRKNVLSSLDTLNDQSFGISQSGAKIETIKLLNNGTNQADASSKARSIVNDFWTQRQRNLVAQHQLEVQQLNQTLVTADSVGATPSEMFESNYSGFEIRQVDYTLANASTAKVYDVYSDSGDLIHSFTDSSAQGLFTQDGYEFLTDTEYPESVSNLESKQNSASTATSDLVANIYANYSAGDITVDESVGPLEETRLLSTNYNTTGGTSYLSASYRQMGLASDFNASFEITYSNQDMTGNKTVTGNLFVEESGYNNFSVGESYTAENRTAYMIYRPSEDEPATSVNLDGTFTVENLYDSSDGSQLNSTSVQSSSFYTPDIDKLSSQLAEYQQNLEDLESSGFGSGAGFGFGSNSIFLIVIAGLLLVIVGAFVA